MDLVGVRNCFCGPHIQTRAQFRLKRQPHSKVSAACGKVLLSRTAFTPHMHPARSPVAQVGASKDRYAWLGCRAVTVSPCRAMATGAADFTDPGSVKLPQDTEALPRVAGLHMTPGMAPGGTVRRKRLSVDVAAVAATQTGPTGTMKTPPPEQAVEGPATPHWKLVLEDIAAGAKIMVCQTAPVVRVSIAEEFGLSPGVIRPGQMVTALRLVGFRYVFDTVMGADLTIMEEGNELLARIEGRPGSGPLPLLTSCCPGWVAMVEKSYPELIPYLSSCKSPQLMLGSVVKSYFAPEVIQVDPTTVSMTSIMPCVRKQAEADRPHHMSVGIGRDVDHVITVQELGVILRDKGVDIEHLPDSPFDLPFGEGSGGGVIFGSSGGVMEAALRLVADVVTGHPLVLDGPLKKNMEPVRGLEGIKEAGLTLMPRPEHPLYTGKELEVKVAVANGLGNAKKLVKEIESGKAFYHFIEVMACPGGCIAGGGQPRSRDKEITKKRQLALYNLDAGNTMRHTGVNPQVVALYNSFLGLPNEGKAHELLHTHYSRGGCEICGGNPGSCHGETLELGACSLWIPPSQRCVLGHVVEEEAGNTETGAKLEAAT